MKQVRAFPVSIADILSSEVISGPFHYVTPVKATLLGYDMGTLLKDESGKLYLAQKGEWFRNGTSALPQIEEFDELQAMNLTVLKKEIVEMKSLSETGEVVVKEVEIMEVAKKKKKDK